MNTVQNLQPTPAEIRHAIFTRLGLDLSAEFVPWSQSRSYSEQEAKKRGNAPKNLNWKVTLRRGTQKMTIDYTQGIGHLPNYPHKPVRTLYDEAQHKIFLDACETGKLRGTPVIPPTLEDVMYCLISDASVLDYSSYEAWGPDLGYDPDSRKGEQTYQACLQQSLALRHLIGEPAISELQEAYAAY